MFFIILLNFQLIRVYPSFSMVKSRNKYKVFSKDKVVIAMVVFVYVNLDLILGILLF